MTKTLIPTYHMRWVTRQEFYMEGEEGFYRDVKVLQQRFTDTGGHNEQWIDVPEAGE